MKNFEEKVFSIIKKIPKGRVSTYSLIASVLGNKKSSRAVGNALKKNKDIPNTPCHRVVRQNGQIGGYVLGQEEKKKMLEKEGLQIEGDKIINFDKKLYYFK